MPGTVCISNVYGRGLPHLRALPCTQSREDLFLPFLLCLSPTSASLAVLSALPELLFPSHLFPTYRLITLVALPPSSPGLLTQSLSAWSQECPSPGYLCGYLCSFCRFQTSGVSLRKFSLAILTGKALPKPRHSCLLYVFFLLSDHCLMFSIFFLTCVICSLCL